MQLNAVQLVHIPVGFLAGLPKDITVWRNFLLGGPALPAWADMIETF